MGVKVLSSPQVKVKVRLLGVFRGFSGKSRVILKLKKPTVGSAVQGLAKLLPAESRRLLIDPELDDPRPNALILLNGREISALNGLETLVSDCDEITLIPVSHGG